MQKKRNFPGWVGTLHVFPYVLGAANPREILCSLLAHVQFRCFFHNFAHEDLPYSPTMPLTGQARPGIARVAVAGTTCTSWSRLGARWKWTAASAIAFLAWAFETKFWAPDLIVHECTSDFDIGMLQRIFGEAYIIQSLVFSPVSLGIPASRPRRYTLMIARDSLVPQCPFTREGFGALMFKRCVADGHIFWTAPPEEVASSMREYYERLRLAPVQASGDPWECEDLLPASQQQRLWNYRKACKKACKCLRCIVNLQQEAHFMRSLSERMPCLLTKTSSIWSMRHSRLLTASEHLGVMGVPIFAPGRHDDARFNVELLALGRGISARGTRHLAGNGMCLSAIGSVLLFALATSATAAPQPAAVAAPYAVAQPPGQAKRLRGQDDDPRLVKKRRRKLQQRL